MRKGLRTPLGWVAVTGMFVSTPLVVTELVRTLRGDPGLHWTHESMGESVLEVRDRVEVRVKGQPVPQALAGGHLQWVGATGRLQRLGPDDVKVRLNHWDAQQADRLPFAMGMAALWGGALVLCGVAVLGGKGLPPAE